MVLVVNEGFSLCSLSCPGTHYVDQIGNKLRDLPASASPVLKTSHLPLKKLFIHPFGAPIGLGQSSPRISLLAILSLHLVMEH